MGSLFEDAPPEREELEEGAVLLRGFAAADAVALVEEVGRIAEVSPFRHLTTRAGYTMSVAMTNCGRVGWVSDRKGPKMPERFLALARRAAEEAGFPGYDPDACLVNRYTAGSKLGLHQDKDEKDAWAPIVSVSLGLPAVFLWGGKLRTDPVRRLRVESGDVAVWGGPARFVYHGIAPLKAGKHELTGDTRINLTFRKVF